MLADENLNSVKHPLLTIYKSRQDTNDFSETVRPFCSKSKIPAKEGKQRLINDKPVFKNNLEKYEWLVKNEPENLWLQEFRNSKEYRIYYE
jgi:hypothetical protein